jgi:hypothetical protein
MKTRSQTAGAVALATMLALSAISLTGCCSTRAPRGDRLSAAEQFSTVTREYPAVAEHLFASDFVLDVLSRDDLTQLIHAHLVVENNPERAARLQEAARLSGCLETGLQTCGEFSCTVQDDQCDVDCGAIQDEARRVVCEFTQMQCRTSARLSCLFVPEAR